MAPKSRNSGRRTGNRTASRQSVVDDDDDEDDEDGQTMSEAELLAQVRAAVGRSNNNFEAVGLTYLRDIRKLRQQRNKARQQVQDLLEEMPEGSLTFVGEEADAIRQLLEGRKLDPKKLASLLGDLEDKLAKATQTNLENDRKLLFSRVAEATGWNREAVEIAANNGQLHVELRTVEVDGAGADKGKKVKKDWPFVRPKGDDKAPLVRMDEFLDGSPTLKVLWPALKAGSGSQNGDTRTSGATSAVVDGTSAPRGGSSGESNMVKDALARESERLKKQGNPLDFLKAPIGVTLR